MHVINLLTKIIIMIIITILLTNISIIFCYNVVLKNAIIARNRDFSYFGYTILLRKPWMIVGAPKANFTSVPRNSQAPREPGTSYRCNLETVKCEQFRPNDVNDESGFITQVNYNSLVKKEYGWFGAAMALDENDDLITVCAPRTILSIFSIFDKHVSMHGVCYSGKISSGNLQLEDNFKSHDFLSNFWYNPLHGFSIHYSKTIGNKEKSRMITGAPKHEIIGTVQIKGQKTSATLPTTDDLTQFGYAVTSGSFFDKSKVLFAAGAPGWNLIGQVGILNPEVNSSKLIMSIKGQMVGEYFGASLAVGDINNDGYDDLIIGSPHWGNDNGRVYIYFGSTNRFLEPPIIINGPKEDGCFGYSITSGDLDSDGYYDVIVGAPWEDNGVVYIYNGDIISTMETDLKMQIIRVKSSIKTFGFSLSTPVDIDNNGFPDIAIGAYKTGHALVLKSRPVLKTNLFITSSPRTLDRNSTNFILKICVEHFKIGKPILESFNLTIDVDETLERVNQTKNVLQYVSKWNEKLLPVCFDKFFYLLESNKNFIDSIDIKVTHKFNNKTILENEGQVLCELCPIEYKGQESMTEFLSIPFNTECGLDEVCTSLISLSTNFIGVNDQLSWIIGSKDISLELNIKNEAEPAYLTTISIELPQNIYLSSVLPFCQENTDGEFLKVICDVDNPLSVGTLKTIRIDLDMSQLNDGNLNGTTVNFDIKISTRSQNNGDQHLSRSLLLLSKFDFNLQGNANDKNYYYSSEDKSSSNISFQHAYQLQKIGETPVLLSKLNINVPVKFQGVEIITLTNKPRIFISGKLYKCSTLGITVTQKLINYSPVILKEEQETYQLNTNESKSSKLLKRNIDQFPDKLIPMMISNPQLQSEALIDINAQKIYLNCTSIEIECGKITCEIGSLNTDQDTGGLQLDFSINPVLWNSTQDTEAQIIFTTDAWIDVIKPTIKEIANSSNLTAYINTNIYKIDSNKNKLVSIWIIVGSVFLGLLAVSLIAFILYKYGFFNRSKKEELVALKNETDNISEPSEL